VLRRRRQALDSGAVADLAYDIALIACVRASGIEADALF
jgi:hypothetical protein